MVSIEGAAITESPPPSAAPKFAVVTVHGTNDADATTEGTRWWQKGSDFSGRLMDELSSLGIDAEIIPVRWSGANSDFDRLTGSQRLAKQLAALEREKRPHAIIGHSHGGNVTMEALCLRSRAPHLASVVTFGTPFFTRRLKAIPFLIALFKILLGLVIAPVMAWYLFEILPSDSNKKIESVVLFGGLFFVTLWGLRSGLRELTRRGRISRLMPRVIDPKRWLVIHSPRDEAMRLLEAAAQIEPQYVTVPSAVRSITTFGTIAGFVGTLVFLGYSWRYFLDPIIAKMNEGTYGLALAADLTFLLVLPVVYGAIYGAFWLIARLGGGWLYAKALSHSIHGGVLGAAYGGDSRYKLTSVTRTPPYAAGATESRIEALNLGGIDDKAIFVSAQQLYDGIVAQEDPNAGLGDPDKLWKHLSDALYHNAYMRDDGVLAHVAAHIAVSKR